MTFADQLFAADTLLKRLEADLFERLMDIYGEARPAHISKESWIDVIAESYHHDYYDESIEVFGVKPSAQAFDALVAMGFRRVWQHEHVKEVSNALGRSLCSCQPTRPAE